MKLDEKITRNILDSCKDKLVSKKQLERLFCDVLQDKYSENIIAFARHYQNQYYITVVPRFVTGLVDHNQYPFGMKLWNDTNIIVPEKITTWKNVFTNQTIQRSAKIYIGDMLQHFPVCLLSNEEK